MNGPLGEEMEDTVCDNVCQVVGTFSIQIVKRHGLCSQKAYKIEGKGEINSYNKGSKVRRIFKSSVKLQWQFRRGRDSFHL